MEAVRYPEGESPMELHRQRAIEQAQRDIAAREKTVKASLGLTRKHIEALVDALAKRFAEEAKANRAKIDDMLAEADRRLAANERRMEAVLKSQQSLIRMGVERAGLVALQKLENELASRKARGEGL